MMMILLQLFLWISIVTTINNSTFTSLQFSTVPTQNQQSDGFSNCISIANTQCFRFMQKYSNFCQQTLYPNQFFLFQGYGVEHTLEKWSELNYTSHWIVLGMYLVSAVLQHDKQKRAILTHCLMNDVSDVHDFRKYCTNILYI